MSDLPIQCDFEWGPQSWCSYDYHASIVSGGTNVFILTTWSREGGPDGGPCVWTDHTRWSADTPERPLSILPLIFYRSWIDAGPVDLRRARLSVCLRGDGLQLDGARCTFWVYGLGTRWHLTGHPVEIATDQWETPVVVTLTTDEAQWHRSWSSDPNAPAPLNEVLADCASYGFAFTGFTSEVSGRLSMADFRLTE